MSSRREAIVPAIVLASMAAAFHAWPIDASTPAGKAHVVMALFVAANAVAATWAALRGSARARVAIAVTILAGGALVDLVWLGGFRPSGFMIDKVARGAVLNIGASGIAAVALAQRRTWGRWLALAIGICELVSAGINFAEWGFVPGVWVEWVQEHLLGTCDGAVLTATLVGPAMRDAFLVRKGSEIWASRHRAVAAVRWALLADVVAIAMLLVYAWTQPVVPGTAATSQALALLLIVAASLTAARKVVGAILLVIGGLGLAIQTAAIVWLAHRCGTPRDVEIANYYLLFWAPGAVLSLVAAFVLARPVAAILRGEPRRG